MGVVYNEYEFSQAANYACQTMAVYDDARRTIVAWETTLTVVDYVHGDCLGATTASNGAAMDSMRDNLLIAGKRLVLLADIGFGASKSINDENDPSSDWDIGGGPHPTQCNVENIGAGNVSHITWTVKFQLAAGCVTLKPSTTIGTGGEGLVKAFNWKSQHAVDNKGFTNRTISGYLEIVNLSDPDNGASTTVTTKESALADASRAFISSRFDPLDNFERTQNYDMSMDHSRLSFTINDREIQSPNAWPEDVVSIRMPTRATFPWPKASTQTSSIQIDLTIELRQGAERSRAWELFDNLLTRRLGRFLANGKVLIMKTLTISEDYFSNSYSFSFHAENSASMYEQMANLGLFATLGTDWADWRASQWNASSNPYGFSELQAGINGSPPDERGINSCNDSVIKNYADEERPYSPPPKFIYAACATLPSPENSFINTDIDLIEAPEMETTVATTYAPVDIVQTNFEPYEASTTDRGLMQVSGDYETCISKSAPIRKYVFAGRTQRIGYKIPAPALTSINNEPVELVGNPNFQSRYLGKQLCLPVYEAVWSQEYIVKADPGPVNSDNVNIAPDGQPDSQTDGGELG